MTLFRAGVLTCIGFSAWSIQPSYFEKHVIDGKFEQGYQVSVADIDKDGKPDVIALSTSPSQLVWYKNPTWERHTITTKSKLNIDVAPYDIDGDGDPDLALASDFELNNTTSGGTVQVLICPAEPAKTEEWEIRTLDAVPTSHRVRWADLTGVGRKQLLNLPIAGVGAKQPEYKGGVAFKSYAVPATFDPVVGVVIDSSLEMAHGMRVIQWDDDAVEEVLTASFSGVELFDYDATSRAYKRTHIADGHQGKRPQRGSSEAAFGKLRSQYSRFVATIEPWHGNEVVVYEEPQEKTLPWPQWVIDEGLKDGHALACLDIDGDENDEIVAGGRGGDKALRIYQFAAGSAEWERCLLDKGNIAAACVVAADMNQDGQMDIVAIGTSTNNVVWYENLFKERVRS